MNIKGAPAGTQYGPNVGANGSSDPDATEGTGSYTTDKTTVSSKMPLLLRETPQSVTVITEQRLQDQQLHDVQQVLQQTPGITTVYGNTGSDSQLNPTYYSRGFAITSFQIDGGAPISYGASGNNGAPVSNFTPTFDLSQYDRVEVVRGSDGVNVGTGSPGGVISLERKRPVDKTQVQIDGELGSFSKQRGVFDISTPLFATDLLRIRVVGTHDDSNYFYQSAYNHQNSIYYNIEFDPFEKTQINFGGTYDSKVALPWFGGLPRFSDGSDLRLPRSTCLCAPWSITTSHGPTYFVELHQGLAKDWDLKVHLDSINQTNFTDSGSVSAFGFPPGISPSGSGAFLTGGRNQSNSLQYAADATVSGAFDVLGHRQEVYFGGNYSYSDNNDPSQGLTGGTYQFANYPGPGSFGTIPNLFAFSPASVPKPPSTDLIPNTSAVLSSSTTQYAAYASARLSPWEPLHVIISDRFNAYSFKNLNSFDFGAGPIVSGFKRRESVVPFPNFAVTFDIIPKTLTIYGSRESIYQSQALSLTKDLTPVAPETGVTYEVGLKRSDFNGTLNSSIAFFEAKQINLAIPDPTVPIGSPITIANPGCCSLAGSGTNLSKGLDVEINGAVTHQLQVQAGYTYNVNKFTPDPTQLAFLPPGATSTPLVGQQPKSLFKLFATYQPEGPEWIHNATFGMGARWQSSSFATGSVCSTTACTPYQFTQNPYAVFDALVKYQFTKAISGQINVTNLFDKTYYTTIGNTTGGSWYGQPRAVMASLHAVF